MPKKKTETQKDKSEILLGIDYGDKNIGIAFGTNEFVNPLKIVNGANTQAAIHEISRFVIENKVDRVIVGLPLTAEGKETAQSLKTRKFVRLLKIIVKKPVDFFNEYGSSKNAWEEAIEMGIPQSGRRNTDHLSAAVILKRYYQEA